MSTGITQQRKYEIDLELSCAAHYFKRLSVEIENDPLFYTDGLEQQTVKSICQGLLLLQWRFRSPSDVAGAALPQRTIVNHTQDHIVHSADR